MSQGMGSFWARNWWVGALCTSIGFIYVHALKEKNGALRELAFRLQEMEKEKFLAAQEKDELHLRISSQNDPAWIETILMRDLGVVPEGYLKVHFKK
jgi:hypothetical protein